MSPCKSGPAAAWALALLGGCAGVPEDAGFSQVESLVSARLPQRVVWRRGGEEDRQAAQAVAALLREELTADSAVQVALLNNAELQASFEELGIAQADLVQAGLLSNPVFEIEARVPGRPHHPLEVHVLQEFLDVLARPLRKRVAEERFEAVRLHVAQAALDLATEVRIAFVEAQAAEQSLEMRRSVAEATGASAEAWRAMGEAGNATELAVAEEMAMDAEARLATIEAEAERLERREDLTRLMGLWGEATGWTLASRLPELPVEEIALEGLESLAIGHRLDLAAAAQDAKAAAAALGLSETAAALPTLEIGLHFEREPDGAETVGPSIAVALPVFDQGQPRVAEAESRLRQARQRHLALAVAIRSEVRAVRARMLAARARADGLRSVLLPLRHRIVEAAQLQHNAMQIGVDELLAARRAEIAAGGDYVSALRDYWLARTALDRAMGGALGEAP